MIDDLTKALYSALDEKRLAKGSRLKCERV